MNPYFSAAKELTPNLMHIDVMNRNDYKRHRYDLFRKGLPFIVSQYYETRQHADIISILKQEYKHLQLVARKQSTASEYHNEREYIRVGFVEYLNMLTDTDSHDLPYAANNSVGADVFKLLGMKHPFDDIGPKAKDPNIWLGPSGSATPLHKDSTDNISIQLLGRKRWTLYSIIDHDYLYFSPSRYGSYDHPNAEYAVSAAVLNGNNNEQFPLFPSACSHSVTIEEGDLLYIPYGWGHAVENLSTSIMLNVWFSLDHYRPLIIAMRDSHYNSDGIFDPTP